MPTGVTGGSKSTIVAAIIPNDSDHCGRLSRQALKLGFDENMKIFPLPVGSIPQYNGEVIK